MQNTNESKYSQGHTKQEVDRCWDVGIDIGVADIGVLLSPWCAKVDLELLFSAWYAGEDLEFLGLEEDENDGI
jgi:hypothetical protein